MIEIKVGLVLHLTDECSGRALERAAPWFLRGGRTLRAIAKPDGLFVFTGEGWEGALVEVRAPGYLPSTVRVPPRPPDAPATTIELRLYPAPSAGRRDVEWLPGLSEPDSEILALIEHPARLRLQSLENEGGAAVLTIGGYVPENLSGKRFALNSGRPEQLILSERLSPASYRTAAPIAGAYAQGETLWRACRTRSGPDGRYALPADPGSAGRETRLYRRGPLGEEWIPL